MEESESDRITIRCRCGAKLKMPVAAAGRRAKCPKCTHTFVIPKPSREPEEQPGNGLGDSGSLLDELADQAGSAPSTEQAPRQATDSRCPKCNAAMPATAVLCVSCGYDSRSGKTHKRASLAAAALSKLAAASGTFFLGCFLSGVGALVGALIWVGIAIGVGYELGWIAWGIGVLAGFGMLKGYGEANTRCGVVAAGMAFAGVVAAKIMIFVFIAYAVFTGNTQNIDLQRGYTSRGYILRFL